MSAALDLLHGLVLDDGRVWGEVATDWQQADAAAVLEPGDGPRLHFQTKPKGGSKSTDGSAVTIGWSVEQAPDLAIAYIFSADLDQSNRLLDRARGLIHRTPGLSSVLRVEARRIVNVRNGARVEALPADVAGSEGLLTPFIVLEELPNWTETRASKGILTAALSVLPKWPGARLVVIGHAGDPAHFSYKLLERARVSPRWRVSEIPGPLPWVNPEDLAEQEALLLPSEYARRHLNIWTAGEDRLADPEALRACVGHDGPLDPVARHRYVIGLDVGLTNDRTVACVGHAEQREGRMVVVVDRLEVWTGTRLKPVQLSAVEAWLRTASDDYGRAPVIFDPYQAAHLTQRLRATGLRCVEFTFSSSSVGRLAVTLFRAIRERGLDLPDDADLLDELAHIRLVERSPGVYRIDHDSGRHDDRAVALSLVAEHLTSRGPVKATISRPGAQHVIGRSSVETIERIAELERTGQTLPSWLSPIRRD